MIENAALREAVQQALEGLPGAVRQWLRSASFCADPDQREAALDVLQALNRDEFPTLARFGLLESLVARCDILLAPYRTAPEPPVPSDERWAAAVTDLVREVVLGYSRVVNALLSTRDFPGYEELLGISLERTIRFLSLLVLESYDTYRMPTDQVWFALHRFFAYAEENGLQDRPLGLPGVRTRGAIGRSYKQILLAALADPYRLAPGQAWMLYRYLADWVDRCNIVATSQEREEYGFVVDLGSDDEARFSLLEADPFGGAEQLRLVEVEDLIVAVEAHVGQLAALDEADLPVTHQALSTTATMQMLRRALHAWKRNSHRDSYRYESQDLVDIVWGIEPIYQHLVGLEATRELEAPDLEDDSLLRACQVVNESTGGYCLAMADNVMPDTQPLQVGRLVFVAGGEFGRAGGLICIARWLQNLGEEGYRFGIQILGQGVQPVRVLPLTHNGSGGECSGVRVMSRVAEREGVLAVPFGIYQKGCYLFVTADGERVLVRATERLEQGSDHDLIRYYADTPF